MRVITLATLNGLPQARVLARSLRNYEQSWSHEVVLMATADVAARASADEAGATPRSVADLLDVDIAGLLSLHDEEELSALLLPALLQRLAWQGEDPVVHLPGSTWVLGGLEPIAQALTEREVMLVPRMTHDLPDDGLRPSRAQMELAGRVERTIIGVRRGKQARAFLAWWEARVVRWLGSLDAKPSRERPEDRSWLARYLELAPARFATAVLEDPGCNLNEWNLHRHSLHGSVRRPLVDDDRPVRFLNLAGYDPDRPHQLSRQASRARVSRSPLLHELSTAYATELRACGWHDREHRAEIGRQLADDLVYDESMRAAYACALALGEPVDDLFASEGTQAFIAWLAGPAPRGGAYGISRYLYFRLARERADVLRAYPDLDGEDGPECLAWCWAFGRDELGIPERFMPARPGQAPPGVQRFARVATLQPPVEEVSTPERRPSLAHRSGGNALAVRVTGYLGHTLGLGAAARGYVQALGAAGVPVSTVSVPLHHLELPVELAAEYGRHGFEDLVHEGAHGFEIVAVNAEELPDLVKRLGDDYFDGPRIGIWGWETNTIPPRWSRAFALVDEIWVYSRFMAENIGAVAPVPVIALPPPVQAPHEAPEPLRLDVPEGFLFLFVFDYLSTVQRKNPVGLIEAFRLAFAPGEGPQLLIKTINAPLRPLAEEEVLWAAHGRDDIHVVDRSLAAGQLHGVMAACDCYVSLHRSEGFGLTMAEAMAIGKPVIGTGYSGNVDFMNADNSYLIDYTVGRVGPDCEIYPPEGEWANPSVEHAAQLMRSVHDDQQQAARRGARAAHDVAATLSPKATGAAMRRRLQELTGGIGGRSREPEAERARAPA